MKVICTLTYWAKIYIAMVAYTEGCIRVSSRNFTWGGGGKRTDCVAVGHSDGEGVGGKYPKLVLNYLPLVTTCNNLWSPKGVA